MISLHKDIGDTEAGIDRVAVIEESSAITTQFHGSFLSMPPYFMS